MPRATLRQVRSFARERGRIRLTCWNCVDHDTCDGVHLIPRGWRGVSKEQTLREALSFYDDKHDAPDGHIPWMWWTHIGTCPECVAEEDVKERERKKRMREEKKRGVA